MIPLPWVSESFPKPLGKRLDMGCNRIPTDAIAEAHKKITLALNSIF
jgi:hypothetical protein